MMSKDHTRIDPEDMRPGDVIKRSTWGDGVTNTYIGPHPHRPNNFAVADSAGIISSRRPISDSYWQLVERADDKSSKDETYTVDTWVDIHGPDDVTNGDIIRQRKGGGQRRVTFIGLNPKTSDGFFAVDDEGRFDGERTFGFGYQKLVRTELQPPRHAEIEMYTNIYKDGSLNRKAYIDPSATHVIDRHEGWKIYHVVDGKKGPAYTVLATPNNTNQEEGSK